MRPLRRAHFCFSKALQFFYRDHTLNAGKRGHQLFVRQLPRKAELKDGTRVLRGGTGFGDLQIVDRDGLRAQQFGHFDQRAVFTVFGINIQRPGGRHNVPLQF